MVDFGIKGVDDKGVLAQATIHNPVSIGNEGMPGVLAYVTERFPRTLVTKVALNDVNGAQMAVDGTATPTVTENIHNGNDNAYWTGNNLSGGAFNFSSTFSAAGWPVDGTQSIDGTATNNSSEARIDKGSTLDLTPYTALRGSIYISSWPTNGTKQVLVGFQDAANNDLGVRVDIGAYVDTTLFNARQDFTIPLSDMGVDGLTIQSLMLDPVDVGAGQAPSFYLDVLRLQDAGDGYEYLIEPDIGTDLLVSKISVQFEDVYVNAGQQGSFGKSGFLGVSTLANGILLGATANGAPIAGRSALVNDLRDWMQFPQVGSVFSGSDGTNTWVNFILDFNGDGGVPLRSSMREGLTFRISDDLSGLVDMKVWASGYILGDS